MKIAYLFLVHKDPLLLQRTIASLMSEECGFFVHVDAKSEIEGFRNCRADKVSFCEERFPVYWGEFSQVRATMRLMKEALACGVDYEYFVFLQGGTYPIRSGACLSDFFQRNRDSLFMNLAKLPAPGYPLSKVTTLRYPSSKPVRRLLTKALARLGLATRDYQKHLGAFAPYAGHACWAMPRAACEYVLSYAEANPHLGHYFENTFAPDESFFHSIIGNSPFRLQTKKLFVYADWSHSIGHHPAELTPKHVRYFEETDQTWIDDEWGGGEMLFARKFSDQNLPLVDEVDAMINQRAASKLEHLAVAAH